MTRGFGYTPKATHLETFLRAAAERAEGASLPDFVEQEFRDFLTCGVLAHGFARVRCGTCAFECLVPFSCKVPSTLGSTCSVGRPSPPRGPPGRAAENAVYVSYALRSHALASTCGSGWRWCFR